MPPRAGGARSSSSSAAPSHFIYTHPREAAVSRRRRAARNYAHSRLGAGEGASETGLTQASTARLQSARRKTSTGGLLCVGMTRAADRLDHLWLSRQAADNADTRHDMITAGAACGEREAAPPAAFRRTRCVMRNAPSGARRRRRRHAHLDQPSALPIHIDARKRRCRRRWGSPLPPLRRLPRPLSPSGVATIDRHRRGRTDRIPISPPRAPAGAGPSARCTRPDSCTGFCKSLPDLPDTDRPEAGGALCWSGRVRHWQGRATRAACSAAVVAIIAAIRIACGIFTRPQPRGSLNHGNIPADGDRAMPYPAGSTALVVTEDDVNIVDFKTNRRTAGSAGGIPFEPPTQLAIYRDLLAPALSRASAPLRARYHRTADRSTGLRTSDNGSLAGLTTK